MRKFATAVAIPPERVPLIPPTPPTPANWRAMSKAELCEEVEKTTERLLAHSRALYAQQKADWAEEDRQR